MRSCALLVFVFIFPNLAPQLQAVRTATVTNEDIRDAILQVVNVVRATEDKLERHEYRERILGDNMKKAMLVIEKRIKSFDTLKGGFTRMDQRLATVESILLEKDDKEKAQLQKIQDTVEEIQKNLPILLGKLRDEIIDKISSNEPPAQITEPTVSKNDFKKMEKGLLDKVDTVSKTIHGLEKELGKIRDDNRGIRDLSSKSTENLEKVKRQLDTSEQLLEKYESKLSEYNNKIPVIDPRDSFKENNEWQQNFLTALDNQKSQVNKILDDLKDINKKFEKLPIKPEAELRQNVTLNKLEELKDIISKPTQVPKEITDKLSQIGASIDSNREDVNKSLNKIADEANNTSTEISKRFDQIRADVLALGKLEQVMIQTADSVLDTKRRVEYGVHQVIAEYKKLENASKKDINQAMNDRFELFEFKILDEESGALSNLTSKIGEEIDQVWRQIGIMHQQMTTSTDTLNKLQNQTDSYVNGSLGAMDSMKGKVGLINGRMAEVDENLNYLLGRLSLVTQEFNNIKKGLGKALDEIRGTFKAVEDNIKKSGPGPHKISSNEVDVN